MEIGNIEEIQLKIQELEYFSIIPTAFQKLNLANLCKFVKCYFPRFQLIIIIIFYFSHKLIKHNNFS